MFQTKNVIFLVHEKANGKRTAPATGWRCAAERSILVFHHDPAANKSKN